MRSVFTYTDLGDDDGVDEYILGVSLDEENDIREVSCDVDSPRKSFPRYEEDLELTPYVVLGVYSRLAGRSRLSDFS
jgi:hypothetical protein